MADVFCLNDAYSTTRIITQTAPNINNLVSLSKTTLHGGLRTKGWYKSSDIVKPLISIVTVVYNGEDFLEKTIQSVIKQQYDNVEYLIIDGGSTDATLDIIRKYEDYIDYWCSENDKGIYDAMNKGLNLVSGDWVNFMNCGDVFIDEFTISTIQKSFKNNPAGIISGNVKIVDEQGQYLGYKHPYNGTNETELLKYNCVAHQATFMNRKVFEALGGFETQYKIHGDYEYWVRAMAAKTPLLYVNIDIANFCNNGVSSNRKMVPTAIYEQHQILKSHHFINTFEYFIQYYRAILFFNFKTLIRFLLGKS